MENKTNDKTEYIKAWKGHIDNLFLLALTPNKELGAEVEKTLNKLLELVPKVAEDKKLE